MSTTPPDPSPTPAQLGGTPMQMSAAEYEMALARSKSYTNEAIYTLVLYIVLYIPGLIANIVWWLQASNTKKLTGQSPQGMGCLTAMLAVNGAIFSLVCLWVLAALSGASR